jgi:TolB protein
MNKFPALMVAGLVSLTLIVFAAEPSRVVFVRIGPTNIGLFVADSDGNHERPLLPATSLDYNAAFSTDGRWIVFTSERGGSADIYRIHPDGSGLEQLTMGPTYEDQAALSPDGSTLAFVSTRDGGTANIWLLDLATHRYSQLTHNTGGNFRPHWSPDGEWIAFSSDRNTKPGRFVPSWELLQSTAIYIVRRDGSGLRRLTKLDGYYGSPQWSRDGRRIVAYESPPRAAYVNPFDPDYAQTSKTKNSQIVSIDVATGALETHTVGPGAKVSPGYGGTGDIAYVLLNADGQGVQFTSGRNGAAGALRHPSWSPDGKSMVYHKTTLRTENPPTPAFSQNSEFNLFRTTFDMPTYSPDGRQLVGTLWTDQDLLVMNDDGTNLNTVIKTGDKMVVFPRWSPDGTYIAFGIGAFFERPAKPGQLALIRPDGKGLRMLTDGTASSGFASWSPDGKRLVFRVMGNGEKGLRILTLEDGKISTLTNEYDTFPAWSPRGDLIAFVSFRTGDYEIYTIRPDGTHVRQLTASHGNEGHPVWSPDGKWIMFSSSRKGFKDEAMLDEWGPQPYGELFIMRADGNGVRQLTDNQWEDAAPAWRPPVNR